MSAIPIEVARQLAIDRIIQVMQSQYPTVLEATRDLMIDAQIHLLAAENAKPAAADPDDIQPGELDPSQVAYLTETISGLESLHLPPPVRQAYYYADRPIEQIPTNRNPAVFVYPVSTRELVSRSSFGPEGSPQIRRFQVAIAVAFKRSGVEPQAWNHKTLTSDDVLRMRSEIYGGAAVRTLMEFACCKGGEKWQSIQQIDLIDDASDLVFRDQKAVGSAAFTVLEVSQRTMIPRTRCLPDE